MPANEASLRITDSYRAQLLGHRTALQRALTASWATVAIEDLDGTGAAWLVVAEQLVASGKRRAVTFSRRYLATYTGSELGRTVDPVDLDPDEYARGALDGRRLRDVLVPAIITVKSALLEQRGRGLALQMGAGRMQRVAAVEVAAAARHSLSDAMRHTGNVAGWRRATTSNPCGACLAAATGAVRDTAEIPDVHAHCRCIAEPVIRGIRDRHSRPTGEQIFHALSEAEQDALFTGRGGRAKAELIRTGAVDLEQLLSRSPMATVADQITETPLSALRATAAR